MLEPPLLPVPPLPPLPPLPPPPAPPPPSPPPPQQPFSYYGYTGDQSSGCRKDENDDSDSPGEINVHFLRFEDESAEWCENSCTLDPLCYAYEIKHTGENWCELWYVPTFLDPTPKSKSTGSNAYWLCEIKLFEVPPSSPPAAASAATSRILFTATLETSVEEVDASAASAIIANETGISADNVTTTVSSGSALLSFEIAVEESTVWIVATRVNYFMANTSRASLRLGAPLIAYTRPLIPGLCANDGADDVCDDWSTAEWANEASEYCERFHSNTDLHSHLRIRKLTRKRLVGFADFYLYDETDDGQDLKFWCTRTIPYHTATTHTAPL